MTYKEMLHKYSRSDDWRRLYAAYVDRLMSDEDRREFDEKFLVAQWLNNYLLLRQQGIEK